MDGTVRECTQCAAFTKKGKRCSRKTCKYESYCAQHTKQQRKLQVKPSQIPNAGDGLYTLKRIPKGQNITEYKGDLITDKQYDKRGSKYGIQMPEGVLDGRSTQSSLGRWSNHCRKRDKKYCSGNNAKLSLDNKRKRVNLKATKTIQPGKEVYTSYGNTFFGRGQDPPKFRQKRIQHAKENPPKPVQRKPLPEENSIAHLLLQASQIKDPRTRAYMMTKAIKSQQGQGYSDVINKLGLAKGKRKLRKGELHAILYTKDGFKAGSYIGPHTDIIYKVKNDIKPISMVDKTAQAHDIRYSLAKNKEDIRKADLKMLQTIKQKKKEDYWINRKIASIPIKAKILVEKMGIPTSKIATFGGVDNKDVPMLEDKLYELEQQGFGLKPSWD